MTTSYIAEGTRIRCAGFDGIQPTLGSAAHLDNVRSSIRLCVSVVCVRIPLLLVKLVQHLLFCFGVFVIDISTLLAHGLRCFKRFCLERIT